MNSLTLATLCLLLSTSLCADTQQDTFTCPEEFVEHMNEFGKDGHIDQEGYKALYRKQNAYEDLDKATLNSTIQQHWESQLVLYDMNHDGRLHIVDEYCTSLKPFVNTAYNSTLHDSSMCEGDGDSLFDDDMARYSSFSGYIGRLEAALMFLDKVQSQPERVQEMVDDVAEHSEKFFECCLLPYDYNKDYILDWTEMCNAVRNMPTVDQIVRAQKDGKCVRQPQVPHGRGSRMAEDEHGYPIVFDDQREEIAQADQDL